MSGNQRGYDYVNHPYQRVRDALRQDALTVFQSASGALPSDLVRRPGSLLNRHNIHFHGQGMPGTAQ